MSEKDKDVSQEVLRLENIHTEGDELQRRSSKEPKNAEVVSMASRANERHRTYVIDQLKKLGL